MTILDRLFPAAECDPVAGDRWAAGHGASTMPGMHTHRVDSDYQRRAREAFVMDVEGEVA